MARHIKNIACPKCREQGFDKHLDNLAVYSDDSCYCWKCHYFIPGGDSISKFLDKHNSTVSNIPIRLIHLPNDASLEYPEKTLSWLAQYGITRQDMLNNHVIWSDQYERLIFTFWNGDELLGWQGRYFGNDVGKIKRNKWWSCGNMQSISHILLNGKPVKWEKDGHDRHITNTLVLVEDVVSAIKVSKLSVHAMPIFGVNVKSRWSQIRIINPLETILFLDPDMKIHSLKQARHGKLLGFNTKVIFSNSDPKECKYEQIKELLDAKN